MIEKTGPETEAEVIGRKIRAARRSADLTQKAVAERAGIHGHVLSRYETGAQQPRAAVLGRIARAIGCTADSLLDDDGGNVATPKG